MGPSYFLFYDMLFGSSILLLVNLNDWVGLLTVAAHGEDRDWNTC